MSRRGRGLPPGHFVGYRKFVVDKDWLERQREARAEQRDRDFKEWSKKWITITRLKQSRLWTDGAINKWLGEPTKMDKYKVFSVSDVRKAESKKDFKLWLAPRLSRKIEKEEEFGLEFEIPKLGDL